jgi:hypothetical protein
MFSVDVSARTNDVISCCLNLVCFGSLFELVVLWGDGHKCNKKFFLNLMVSWGLDPSFLSSHLSHQIVCTKSVRAAL